MLLHISEPNGRYIKLGIVFLLLILMANVIVMFGLKSIYILIALIMLGFSILRIKFLLFVIFAYSIIEGFILTQMQMTLPFQNYSDELLITPLLILLIINRQYHHKLVIFKPAFKYVSVFIIVVLISTVFNAVPFKGLANFMSTYLKWIIFMAGVFAVYEYEDVKKIIGVLIAVGFLQIVVASIQFYTHDNLHLLAGTRQTIRADSAYGTFGHNGHHALGSFSLMLFISMLYLAIQQKRMLWIVLGTAFLHLYLITFTEVTYLFLAPLLGINVFLNKKIKLIYRAIILVVTCCAGVYLLMSGVFELERYSKYYSNPKQLLNTGKVQSFALVKKIFKENPTMIVAGSGPAMFSSGIAYKMNAPLFNRYIKQKWFKFSKSIINLFWCSVTTLLVETGVLGFLAYFGLFFHFIRQHYSFLKNHEKNITSFESGIVRGTIVILFFILFLSFWDNNLELKVLMYPLTLFICASSLIEKKYTFDLASRIV